MLLDQDLRFDDVDAGSNRIPPTEATDAEADAESTQNFPTTQRPSSSNIVNGSNNDNGLSSSTRPRANKKRSRAVQGGQDVAQVIRDSVKSRDKILAHKNQQIENHPEFSCSQLRAMEVLHSLRAIKMCLLCTRQELVKAGMPEDHLGNLVSFNVSFLMNKFLFTRPSYFVYDKQVYFLRMKFVLSVF
ncbi:unnamed protein product [Microthlaspi erraticum]|uniref:Uncharacterized protein n=1 Tax=Microthlaspi erraticum TaxID=1685480 RepID=A0A6D2HJF7_9BRAS|nr:unnamed protein product [Microthlaspi erraticum]